MPEQLRVLILGSKEYPLGVSTDKITSGGFEKFVSDLAANLVELKITPVVITRSFECTCAFEVLDGVEVHRVNWASGFYFRNISFNFFAFLKALKVKHDVVIANGFVSGLFALALRVFTGRKVIFIPAGFSFTQPQYPAFLRRVLKQIEKFTAKSADAVVFLSNEEKEKFKKLLGFSPAQSQVIYTGVNFDDFKPVKKTDSKRLQVLFVGRLIEVKGVKYLLEAIKKIDVNLTIVGSGPQEKELHDYANELGIMDKVLFVGFSKTPQEYFKHSDVFVLPSISEGLPLVLLEAMASKLAIVCTDINLPVVNEKTGLVVPVRNAKAITHALEKLKDEKLRSKLSANAFEFAKDNFNWKKTAKLYANLCEKLSK